LTCAGDLIQQERKSNQQLSQNDECLLLIKAIRINTLSKLTYGDIKKFISLLIDIFPGIEVSQDIEYETMTRAIIEVLEELKLAHIQT
jgi:dynein heavy chain 2